MSGIIMNVLDWMKTFDQFQLITLQYVLVQQYTVQQYSNIHDS